MKQSLQLGVGQNLTMTPQLQQAIRLLQLSSLDLQTEIQTALEYNPMLEVDEESTDDAPAEDAGDLNVTANSQASDETDRDPVTGTDDPHTDSDFSSAWSDIGHGIGHNDDERDFLETHRADSNSLRDHLLEQIHLSSLDARDRQIAAAIVDAVGDDGYLADTLDETVKGLRHNGLPVTTDEAEAILHFVQHLDPVGIAARNPRECMAIQLAERPGDENGVATARRIVADHLEQLGAHDFNGLRRALRVDEPELVAAIEAIQSLDPRPGSQITSEPARYVVPDLFVRKESGAWQVSLNPDIAPRLRIHPTYAGLVKRADPSADNAFLRDNLQQARWFIKSVQSRNETLQRVAIAIVERQRAFLEYGDEAMKPLVLREIAEELEMHESTISRVTTEKYMHTPRGIFEFKYFFSSHVTTTTGGECSATAIRAMICRLVDKEDRRKPLSDQRLAGILVERGIDVARRTVAKYRESLTIPPSSERKQLR